MDAACVVIPREGLLLKLTTCINFGATVLFAVLMYGAVTADVIATR